MGTQSILGTPLFSADVFQWARFRNAKTMMTLHNMAAILQLIGCQRDMQSLLRAHIFDIGDPFYGQLTPLKIWYSLNSIT